MPKKPAKSQKGHTAFKIPARTATKGPRTTEKEGEEQDATFQVPRTPGYDEPEPEPAAVVVEEDRPQAASDDDDEEGGEKEPEASTSQASTSQSKKRKTTSTTEEVDYSEIAGEEEAPKKVGIKFSQRDELQIITFLKSKPALYMTGFNEYLPKVRKAERLEIWQELAAQMVKDECTPENFETWYWSTRTMYGRCLQKPPPVYIPGTKKSRQQFIYENWKFHKDYISTKKDKQQPSLSRRPAEEEEEAWPPEKENEPGPSTGPSPRLTPRKSTIIHERSEQLASDIAENISFTLSDPIEKGRKMIVDGHFMTTMRYMPPDMWMDFQDDLENLMSRYRRKLHQHKEDIDEAREAGIPLVEFGGEILPSIRTQRLAAQPPQLVPAFQPPQQQPPQQQPPLQQPPQQQPAQQQVVYQATTYPPGTVFQQTPFRN